MLSFLRYRRGHLERSSPCQTGRLEKHHLQITFSQDKKNWLGIKATKDLCWFRLRVPRTVMICQHRMWELCLKACLVSHSPHFWMKVFGPTCYHLCLGSGAISEGIQYIWIKFLGIIKVWDIYWTSLFRVWDHQLSGTSILLLWKILLSKKDWWSWLYEYFTLKNNSSCK